LSKVEIAADNIRELSLVVRVHPAKEFLASQGRPVQPPVRRKLRRADHPTP
jgi:hypothetical protein